MQTLLKLYENPSTSNKVFLMKSLFNMKMVESGSIIDDLNEFNKVTSLLSSMNVNFDEEIRAILVFYSLPKSQNGLVMAMINYVSRYNTLNFDDVIDVILSDKTRRKTLGGSISGITLNTQRRD